MFFRGFYYYVELVERFLFMTIKNVDLAQPPKYFVEPKKSKTGRILMSGIGLAGSAVATGVLLNHPKSIFNPLVIANELEATGIKFFDNQYEALKKVKISRYLPLALGLTAAVSLLYALGSAIDTGNHNRRIKKALKRALNFQAQEDALKNKL